MADTDIGQAQSTFFGETIAGLARHLRAGAAGEGGQRAGYLAIKLTET
jgi:hypothetical protein